MLLNSASIKLHNRATKISTNSPATLGHVSHVETVVSEKNFHKFSTRNEGIREGNVHRDMRAVCIVGLQTERVSSRSTGAEGRGVICAEDNVVTRHCR